MIWFFLIFGLAFADKLDRTYLPPPGSKYSGGSPGAIKVPLEHPKLHSPAKDEYFNPEIAIGIDRVAPKRPIIQDAYSSTNNPSTYSGNSFSVPTTINPFSQNTGFSSHDGYSTASPVYYSSNYSDSFQNPNIANNFYPNQFQQTSELNKYQFTTENYPQRIQANVPIPDISLNNFANGIFNQSLPYGTIDGIVNNNFHQLSPLPQLVTDLKNSQYYPSQYLSSSIPAIDTNTNLVSSTMLPSTVNDYKTTVGSKQFYSSTSKPPQLSTTIPIGSKISPVFNYADYKKRPERIQAQADREATIINYESSISPEGYAYSYDTSNGIHGDESGVTVNGVKAKGSYSYIGDDGKLYSIVYTADENGFQPRGDHLPTSPPIPDAILKVIEQVSKEKEAGIIDDGSYDDKKYGYQNYHNGFYSPKYDIPKVHSGEEKVGILIKNTLKNVDAQFQQQPYNFHNISRIENVGPYKVTDLETGDNLNNGSPSDIYRPGYEYPIIDNERRQFVDEQIPVDKVGKYNDLTKDFSKGNKLDAYNTENSYMETGYQYNPPQYTGKNEFPSRFSDTYNIQKETLKQENSNKMTPKPFLTPYASETNDGQQKFDNNRKPIKDLESEYYDEELTQNNDNYPSYIDSDSNRNYGYNGTNLSDIKTDDDPSRKIYQSEGAKVGDYEPQTINEGYSYQQGIAESGKESNAPFDADRSYISSTSTSTVAPSAFTSRINTSQSNDSKYNAGIPQTSASPIIPSTTYTPTVYQTNIQLNKTSLPNYSTIRPGFINHYQEDIPSGNKVGPIDMKKITAGIEFSTNIPTIGNSYAPNLDINHYDDYNVHQATEKIIGEDFRGPKQPQRFDPLTGYHY